MGCGTGGLASGVSIGISRRPSSRWERLKGCSAHWDPVGTTTTIRSRRYDTLGNVSSLIINDSNTLTGPRIGVSAPSARLGS